MRSSASSSLATRGSPTRRTTLRVGWGSFSLRSSGSSRSTGSPSIPDQAIRSRTSRVHAGGSAKPRGVGVDQTGLTGRLTLQRAWWTKRTAEARRTHSAPIVEAIRQWLTTQGLAALPRSALGKAIPLDNNQTEREMRAVAVGRKNHYGSRSLRGTQVAATFYSLIESTKLIAVDPVSYPRKATQRAIARNGITPSIPAARQNAKLFPDSP